MSILNKLWATIHNYKNLDVFLSLNIGNIYSEFLGDFLELKDKKWEIADNIVNAEATLFQLDYSKFYNSLFVLTLLDFSEKFRLLDAFETIYYIAQEKKIKIPLRHQAAKIYLLDVRYKKDYLNYFERITDIFEEAYKNEEDNKLNIFISFINYLLNAFLDTYSVDTSIIIGIKSKFKKVKDNYLFLDEKLNEFFSTIYDRDNYEKNVLLLIEKLFFSYRQNRTLNENFQQNNFLIEKNTNYVYLLNNTQANFNQIRNISRKIYNNFNKNKQQELYSSLLRGVAILKKEEQLVIYLTLFGEKHRKKISHILNNVFFDENKYNIIDWACGQGISTQLFIEKFSYNKIESIILIEPSTVALKRAGLHLKKYYNNLKIKSINNYFDNIDTKQLKIFNLFSNIHFFSNILDVDAINLEQLYELIINAFFGKNYFICSSPYINDAKLYRIELFISYFSINYEESFEMIFEYQNKNNDPTNITRVFSVHL